MSSIEVARPGRVCGRACVSVEDMIFRKRAVGFEEQDSKWTPSCICMFAWLVFEREEVTESCQTESYILFDTTTFYLFNR